MMVFGAAAMACGSCATRWVRQGVHGGESNVSEEQERQLAVGAHYDAAAFEPEVSRLETLSPVEFAMTERLLARLVPAGSVVVDVGVGAGHYDERLACLGCRLHLVDVSQRLLDTALQRLRSCGRSGCVLDARLASATDLSHLADGSCDVVLLLGPLYHLLSLAERRQAVAEARRVLRPDGLLVAAAINRLAGVRAEYLTWPERGVERHDLLRRFLADGIVWPGESVALGHAHFTVEAEFRELFAGGFAELLLVGLESFTGCEQELFVELSGADREAWLDLVEATAALPEAIGCCEHFLYAGRKH
jgi:SAM-dependent methyltransferase